MGCSQCCGDGLTCLFVWRGLAGLDESLKSCQYCSTMWGHLSSCPGLNVLSHKMRKLGHYDLVTFLIQPLIWHKMRKLGHCDLVTFLILLIDLLGAWRKLVYWLPCSPVSNFTIELTWSFFWVSPVTLNKLPKDCVNDSVSCLSGNLSRKSRQLLLQHGQFCVSHLWL